MTRVRAFGVDVEVENGDYAAVVTACTNLLDAPANRLTEIWRPSETELPCTNQGSRNLLLLQTEESRVIALKRCRLSLPKLERELFVARLRRRYNVNDYPIARREGLVLRESGTASNLTEIIGWEQTPFLLIDFGPRGARFRLHGKHLLSQTCESRRCLPAGRITDRLGFYRQFGEVAALDYLVGSPDRHGANYVYDTTSSKLYSVDHEDGPYSEPRLQVPFEQMRQEIVRTGGFYLPTPAGEGEAAQDEFDNAFVSKWREIADHRSSIEDDETPDNEFVLSRLRSDRPVDVVRNIRFGVRSTGASSGSLPTPTRRSPS